MPLKKGNFKRDSQGSGRCVPSLANASGYKSGQALFISQNHARLFIRQNMNSIAFHRDPRGARGEGEATAHSALPVGSRLND
jgi:hypothetical protein